MIIANNTSYIKHNEYYDEIMTESYDFEYFADIDTVVSIANESLNPDYDEYVVTKEGAIGDFFAGLIRRVKELFQKIINFFKNLFSGKKKDSPSSSGGSNGGSSSKPSPSPSSDNNTTSLPQGNYDDKQKSLDNIVDEMDSNLSNIETNLKNKRTSKEIDEVKKKWKSFTVEVTTHKRIIEYRQYEHPLLGAGDLSDAYCTFYLRKLKAEDYRNKSVDDVRNTIAKLSSKLEEYAVTSLHIGVNYNNVKIDKFEDITNDNLFTAYVGPKETVTINLEWLRARNRELKTCSVYRIIKGISDDYTKFLAKSENMLTSIIEDAKKAIDEGSTEGLQAFVTGITQISTKYAKILGTVMGALDRYVNTLVAELIRLYKLFRVEVHKFLNNNGKGEENS